MQGRALAVAAVMFASMDPAAAQPADLTPSCQSAWGRYAATPGPKAFASAKNGCGWQRKTDSYPDAAAIRAKALSQCVENAGASGGCRISHQSR